MELQKKMCYLSVMSPEKMVHPSIWAPSPFSGATKTDFNMLKLEIGENVEAHEENVFQTNSQNARGAPAITLNCLRTSDSSCDFLSLITCLILTFGVLTTLPMTSWAIDHVSDVGKAKNQPWLEVGKEFSYPITNDEPPNMPTCAHDDNEESSGDPEFELSTNWQPINSVYLATETTSPPPSPSRNEEETDNTNDVINEEETDNTDNPNEETKENSPD